MYVSRNQMLLEGGDILRLRHLVGNLRAGIPDDQIYLDVQAGVARQLRQFTSISQSVVDAAQQHILKGQALTRAQGNGAQRGEQRGGTTFVSDVYPMDVPFVACILWRMFAVSVDAFSRRARKRCMRVPDGIIFYGMAYIFL